LAMVASDAAAARRVRDAAQAQGIGPIEGVMIAPVPANPFRGDVVVQTPSAYHFGAFDWFWRPSVRLDGDVIPRVPRDAVIDAAAATPRARDYLVWSRFPIFRVDTLPDGYRVRITDARYPDMGEAGGLGGVSVRLNSALEPMERSRRGAGPAARRAGRAACDVGCGRARGTRAPRGVLNARGAISAAPETERP